jgi:hypothetical protein
LGGDSQLTAGEVEEIVKPYYPKFIACIEGAWAEYYDGVPPAIRAQVGKRARAAVVHDLMVHQALRTFHGVSGINFVVAKGYVHMSVQGRLLIRLKKLDGKGRPANYQTKQVKDLNSDGMLADIPEAIRLVAGYQLDGLQSALASLLIVAPRGRSLAFKLMIKDYGEGMGSLAEVRDITSQQTSSGTRLVRKDAAPEKATSTE